MRFIRIAVFGLVGLCLGFGLFIIDNSGFFERWQRLSDPSDDIRNLFSSENFPDNVGGSQFIKPCNYSSPEFFISLNAPRNIVDCVQRIDREADAYTRSTFIMDDNSNIWMWRHFWYAYYEYTTKAFFPTLGLVIGMIISFIVNKRLKTKRGREQSPARLA